jgi:hypothetical protein
VAVESTPAYIQIDGETGNAYNEAAFRYFLALERKRAERAVRPLLLLLLKVRNQPAKRTGLAPTVSAGIFSALATCIREVDFSGWYREGVVAAAVIAPNGPTSDAVRRHLSARVVRALQQRLSAAEAARITVRVVELGGRPRI